MKSKQATLLMIVVLGVAMGGSGGTTHGQQRFLPADLVVMATKLNAAQTGVEMRIAWVDADTGSLRDFFVDPQTPQDALRPVAWSPNGKYLLITNARGHVDSSQGYTRQLCILTRSGVQTVCLEDAPMGGTTALREHIWRSPSWSADSRYVYFASIADEKMRLVEADATTGTTRRIVYETPLRGRANAPLSYLTWTTDLGLVGVDFGSDPTPKSMISPQFVDLRTRTAQAIHTLPAESTDRWYYFLSLSPLSSYVMALNLTDRSLNIFDRTVTPLHQIGPDTIKGKWSDILAPTWSPDESVLYFLGGGDEMVTGIYGYRLKDRTVFPAYLKPADTDLGSPERMIFDDFAVAPDNSAIAGRSSDNPKLPGRTQVRVVFFDGTTKALLGDYYYTMMPLWVPPVTP